MTCPVCGAHTVAFAVPSALREHAPGSSGHAAICTNCLRTHAVGGDAVDGPSDFAAVQSAFPDGEAGAALALVLSLLDSLALRRSDIDDCCAYAERAGADVLLTLDRLAAEEGIDPHVDIDRRRHQLAEMLR